MKKGIKTVKKASKSLGLDVGDARKFRVEAMSGGFTVFAKTPKAVNELTRAHFATIGRVK